FKRSPMPNGLDAWRRIVRISDNSPPLTLEQLRDRAGQLDSKSNQLTSKPANPAVAIVGEHLPTTVCCDQALSAGLRVASTHSSVADYLAAIAKPETPNHDAVVFDFSTLHPQTVAEVNRALARKPGLRSVLVYGFASRGALEAIDSRRTVALRAPVDLHEIRLACTAPSVAAQTHDTAAAASDPEFIPHRYTIEQLAHLASSSSKVHCQCPQHLVTLINSLNSFEKYSLECENLTPADAELHAYLYKMTSRARATIEEALAKVAAADKLEV
ncbi:MAG: hypothetical protein P8J87_04500, partial [Verrucomicrobiales bacterium]|nr:hypothetical protein [Verrucomicrobiales bacterium]